jgi:RNA polymerase sigma-70 factor (ECF subfamily)
MEGNPGSRLMQLLDDRAFDQVATLALEAYGAELYGFLIHTMGSSGEVDEVFAQTVEAFWRGLPRFEARCSVRTWLYLLAKHAAVNHQRSPWNGNRRAGYANLDAVLAKSRSQTAPWKRTDVKDKWRAMRDALTPEDRALLVLRVDRGLHWADIARVTLGDAEPEAAALARETARLRKRFQLLKQQLHAKARAAGLLEDAP